MILVLPVVFETEKLQMEQQQQLQQRQVSPDPGPFASGEDTCLLLQHLGRPAVNVWVEIAMCSVFRFSIVFLDLVCHWAGMMQMRSLGLYNALHPSFSFPDTSRA